jgi:type IV secretion system protein VirB10
MNAVPKDPKAESAETLAANEDPPMIAGDRGIPSINRARTMQARLSTAATLVLICVVGFGLLTWYYARALSRPAQAQHAAQAAAKGKAQGEMALPPLGHIDTTFLQKGRSVDPPPPDATLAQVLGSAPPLSPALVPPPVGGIPMQSTSIANPVPQPAPAEVAPDRRLIGPAFARASLETGGISQAQTSGPGAFAANQSGGASAAGPLAALLHPTAVPAVDASVLPTRRFLLSKGTFIDCTLETAIDSTLPGMTTCITATDTFSVDGSVVLLERGTKLVGETRGQVQQGTSRIFVLWTEARTPTGVVVPLASPGTDELGRAGLSGEVNRHFWDRFGAAILLTVINGAVQSYVQSQSNGTSVIVSPASTSDVMTEVLRDTIAIPPTVTKAQGDRIQVFVARDVDFRPVYALRVATATPVGSSP